MDKKILFVRGSFIIGAVIDALLVPPLMFPKLAGLVVLGTDSYSPAPMDMYMMNVAAALMAGWTGILLWAAVKPLERGSIIPITVFILLPGLIAAGVFFYISGGISLERMIPLWAISLLLIIAQSISYFLLKNIGNNENTTPPTGTGSQSEGFHN